jgi:hypothetical protein
MSLRLTYGVRGGRLANLDQALVEAELSPDAAESQGTGYVVVKTGVWVTPDAKASWRQPSTKAIWRLPLRAGRATALRPASGATTPSAAAVVASDHPRHLVEALIYWKRLELLDETSWLQIIAFDRTGKQFGDNTYNLSNHQVRDGLFQIAYARATRGLSSGCASADAMCKCGD